MNLPLLIVGAASVCCGD